MIARPALGALPATAAARPTLVLLDLVPQDRSTVTDAAVVLLQLLGAGTLAALLRSGVRPTRGADAACSPGVRPRSWSPA